MKHFFRLTALLCVAMLSLSGCGQEKSGGTGMGSKVWDSAPAITYGTMEYETLAVESWDSGRCEATSFYAMAETEAGFYYIPYASYSLHYADKSAPGNWMPVCKDPDCKHGHDPQCSAFMETHTIYIKDGRIWFEQLAKPELYSGTKIGKILVSMAPDGTDRQLEYALEEAMFGTAGGGGKTLLTPHHWLHSTYTLQPDGSSLTRFFRVTEEGVTELPATNANEQHTEIMAFTGTIYGDPYLLIDALDGDNDYSAGYLYWLDGDKIKTLDMAVLTGNGQFAGAYVSGSVLRSFRQNDGYYDLNLETGEEVRLADARLENSRAYMVLPNCIIETTLYEFSVPREAGDLHKMELFDGETWHAVALPKELENAPADTPLSLLCVTSDSILFACTETVTETVNKRPITYRQVTLYRIPIGTGQWNLEYLATIRLPS